MRVANRVIVVLTLALAVAALSVTVAQAQDPLWVPIDKTGGGPGGCLEPCHMDNSPFPDDPSNRYGPHGFYFPTTNRCRYCHRVHDAEELAIFQEASPTAVRDTISDLCFICHDNTGRMGVYSQLQALGFTPGASHSVDASVPIIGGVGSMTLTCTSCHTPHNNTKMAGEFVSFNTRVSEFAGGWSDTLYQTNRLLRDDINGAPKGTYTEYNAAWCAACHTRRHESGPIVNNHPVDTQTPYRAYTNDPANAPELGVFIFDDVTASAFKAPTSDGRMTPRPDAPTCQQCHETNMDVEGQLLWSNGNYNQMGDPGRKVDPDGPGPSVAETIGDSFPHQTVSTRLLVETGDDLCLNCHATYSLP